MCCREQRYIPDSAEKNGGYPGKFRVKQGILSGKALSWKAQQSKTVYSGSALSWTVLHRKSGILLKMILAHNLATLQKVNNFVTLYYSLNSLPKFTLTFWPISERGEAAFGCCRCIGKIFAGPRQGKPRCRRLRILGRKPLDWLCRGGAPQLPSGGIAIQQGLRATGEQPVGEDVCRVVLLIPG